MKALLIELDPDTAARLDKVAPGRSRRRSEFIRAAIRRALWDLEERATEEAYRRQPDSTEDAHVDPAVWETLPSDGSPRMGRPSPRSVTRRAKPRVRRVRKGTRR